MALPDFLHGAVDLHVHSKPDTDPRRFDDIDLVREAMRAGMSGVLLKSHGFSTVERAWLVSRVLPGIQVFGGIVLNETVGGFNPAAVELVVRLGARQVWMPTRSARNHRRAHGHGGGLTVFDEDGTLRPEVDCILRLIAAGDCILGTGHLGPSEAIRLIDHARAAGVRRILITHPEWSVTSYSIGQQQSLAAGGDVWFERCFVSTTHRCGYTPMVVIEEAIEQIGPGTTVIATDLGQPDTPPPVEGLQQYAARLHADGFTVDDLRRMMCDNPRTLLERTQMAEGAP